jgi:hypothetical protein
MPEEKTRCQERFTAHGGRRLGRWVMGFLGALSFLWPGPACAQSAGNEDLKEMVQRLADQVRQLQSKVNELEAKQSAIGAVEPMAEKPAAATQAAAPAEPQESMKAPGHTMDIPGGPQMRIQGFTHTGFTSTDQKGAASGFFLGSFDMFVTSRLSEKFSMLAELTFEAGEDNNFGVDLERMLLVYKANDYFQLSFGRSHADIGYYNTAYHHGNWFETAAARPVLFVFEDQGGVLPVHNVGLALRGAIPSGRLGLHYDAEIGNGRPARHPQNSNVQNLFDENNGKSFNFSVSMRPEWARGLQAGLSVYHDHLIPDLQPRIQETIPAAYIVYITPKFEFLNEGVLIRHSFDHTHRVLNMPGFYTQIGRQWGPVRPYFRYQYLNTSPLDPVIGDVGRMHGPSAGIRYDWSEFAALKLQYDHNFRRGLSADNHVTALVAFTF